MEMLKGIVHGKYSPGWNYLEELFVRGGFFTEKLFMV